MSPLAASLARLAGSPLWLQVHGIDAWEPPRWSVRWGAEQATLITSTSRYTKSCMARWWQGDPSLIRVLPNTVGIQFSPGRKPLALMGRYQLVGRRVILTVSRLSSSERYKGHDKVIAALPEVSAKIPDVAYLIVGGGDDVERLRRFAAERGVSDRVVFAGHVPECELPDHFRVADVFAMPSSSEGFGIVFLEAAMTGLPVIGGNRDGSADALADGQIGSLVNPEAPEQIVEALIDALKGRHVGNSAAMKRFAFEHYARHIDSLVQNLVR
jgi:glycosyltransferase involved in cell wall biosynthesis